MRISDWSSDVCSSDLSLRLFSRAPRTCTRPLAAAVQEDSPKELFGMFLSCSSSRSGRDFLSSGAAPAGFERCGESAGVVAAARSEEHTSELQSLMRISYAVFCLNKKQNTSAAEDNQQETT